MKKYSAKGYLMGAVFALFVSYLYSSQAWPLLIKWFVPFPALEQATVYEGKLHIEGAAHRDYKFGLIAPSYYIVDKQGQRHRVFWGYLGDEMGRYTLAFEGLDTKIWFHSLFGVIQEHSTATPVMIEKYPALKKGVIFGQTYQDKRDYFERHFNYDNEYYWAALPSVVALLFAIYYFVQCLRTRKIEKGINNG